MTKWCLQNPQEEELMRSWILYNAPGNVRKDPVYQGIAVGRNKAFYQYLSDDMKRNPLLIATAIQRGAHLSDFVESNVHHDRAVVMVVVHIAGLELKNAGGEFRRDREIVMAAVRQNGRALQYASDRLQHDKEVVKTAVRQDGRALKYAGDMLQIDDDVLMAMRVWPS